MFDSWWLLWLIFLFCYFKISYLAVQNGIAMATGCRASESLLLNIDQSLKTINISMENHGDVEKRK